MKALASSSSSSTTILLHRNIDPAFSSSSSSSLQFLSTKNDVVLFPSNNLCLLHLMCVQRSPLRPISSFSQRNLKLAETSNQVTCESSLIEEAETSNQETYKSETVHVKIQLKKQCSFGEQFAIVGDDPIFGLWDPDSAIPLNWSDDHVWNLELDIPIGKSIQFKFILKETTGMILWQPGPDRVLKTWETKNTIVVRENWEDATSQKLLEEELPIPNENVDNGVNSEMGLVAENLIHQNEEISFTVKNEIVTGDVKCYPKKETLPSTDDNPIIADNITSSEEKAVTFVADNISNSEEEAAASASIQVPEYEGEADSTKDTIIKEEIPQTNGRVPTVVNSATTDRDKNVIVDKGDDVLVPGLPPVNISEAEIHGGSEENGTFHARFGVNEVKDENSPEWPNTIHLVEKHEIDVEPHRSEKVEVSSDLEQHQNEIEYKPEANGENQQESIAVQNGVVQNDIPWGHRMIQKLLTNLGFL